jgi:hypothetical protein
MRSGGGHGVVDPRLGGVHGAQGPGVYGKQATRDLEALAGRQRHGGLTVELHLPALSGAPQVGQSSAAVARFVGQPAVALGHQRPRGSQLLGLPIRPHKPLYGVGQADVFDVQHGISR